MLTLAAPVLLLTIVCVYSGIRTFVNAVEARRRHTPDSEVSWWDSFKAREHQVAKKSVATATSIFVMASIFFFRCCLKPFKCEDDGSGALFMVSNPEVECGDNDEHNELRRLGYLGLTLYMLLYVALHGCARRGTRSARCRAACRVSGRGIRASGARCVGCCRRTRHPDHSP